MRRLMTAYAINFNLRHKRRGHLFQNRYKSIVYQEDLYLLELTRYIQRFLKPAQGFVKPQWTGWDFPQRAWPGSWG